MKSVTKSISTKIQVIFAVIMFILFVLQGVDAKKGKGGEHKGKKSKKHTKKEETKQEATPEAGAASNPEEKK